MIRISPAGTSLCQTCWRAKATIGKFVDDKQACESCWQNNRAAAKRRAKMRPGVCSTVSTSLPPVKHVGSLPGQLGLFGEGER